MTGAAGLATRAGPVRSGAPAGAPDRVRPAQRQAVAALAQAGIFVLAAALSAGGGARWLALHLLGAGALVSASSGATVLFAVTWSAAPSPGRRVLAWQRGLVGAGAAGVAAARQLGAPDVVLVLAATAFAAGLALLAAILVTTVRRGPQRRFDVAVAWYVAAVAAGLGAAGLGAAIGTGALDAAWRVAHVGLNLLGLVGLVIGGTLPTFAATQARSRLAARARPSSHAWLLGVQLAALAGIVAGVGADVDAIATAGFAAYAAGLLGLVRLLPAPGRRALAWAGPRLVGLWSGIAWWCAAVAATAVEVGAGREPLAGRWLLVLVVAGYGQILWASLAYLGPVLRGGGHVHLAAGFARTRSWVALVAANVAGAGLLAGASALVAVALGLWVVDTAARAAGLLRRATP